MSGTAKATFWAQVEPRWSRWYPRDLSSIVIRKVTQRKPREPEPGCVLIHLTVVLDRSAFVPRELVGEIEIGPGEYEQVPATVEAEPLGDGDEHQ
jgi:hypothetical protein